MRRLLFVAVGCSVWLLFGANSAMADFGIHVKGWGPTPSACAGCHRAHTAKAPYLLKEAQSQLCFACHGKTATGSYLDVQDGVGYVESGEGEGKRGATVAGALRGGGFENARIDSAHPEATEGTYEEASFTNGKLKIPVLSEGATSTSSHSVNESPQTIWGWSDVEHWYATESPEVGKTEFELSCGSCHDPHGNGMYRILRPVPSGLAPYGGSTTNVEAPIPDVESAAGHVYTTSNYAEPKDANAPQFYEDISHWCATCHTRYNAPHHSATEITEGSNSVFTYRHATEYESGTHRPQCVTCHVAHGSDAGMSGETLTVTWPNGELPENPADSRLLRINNRGVCQACHHK